MTMLGKANKIDPYYLIANVSFDASRLPKIDVKFQDLLGPLRVDVESLIPTQNPYSYRGTVDSWSECDLRLSFAHATVVQSDTPESRRMSALPFLSLSVGGAPGPMMSALAGLPQTSPDFESVPPELVLLKMAKFGSIIRKGAYTLLNRVGVRLLNIMVDDVTDGGRKSASRKWKEMTLILTNSHLLFFRDPALAADFSAQSRISTLSVFGAPTTLLKPDEMLPLIDAVALYDSSYKKVRSPAFCIC